MNKAQRILTLILLMIVIPIIAWIVALAKLHNMPKENTLEFIKYSFQKTIALEDWRLIAIYLGAIILTFIVAKFAGLLNNPGFKGYKYKKFLRGTKIVTKEKLAEMTNNRKEEQITISGVPIPTDIENLHFLLNGSTGAGKSVTLREMIECAVKRGDRLVIVDPNADMFSKFAKKGDVLLNPFDKRTKGWSIFNEIKAAFDYRNYTRSIVPKSADSSSEEWNGFARVMLESVMKVLKVNKGSGQNPTMNEVTNLATVISAEELKGKLVGTDAESMFIEGSEKALGSARFVLSSRLPIFKEMPFGDFSIRDFLETGQGNLFITWKESQKSALTPIISAWIDIVCSSILSLEEDKKRKVWLFLDELASLDNIGSLDDALTKGRKNGLRVVAGVQSVSQLKQIYGREGATVLMSNFRSLVVMGGSKTDSETSEEMSKALGEHEVLRESVNKSMSKGVTTRSRSEQAQRERVIMPSEIASMPNLEGVISFAGDYPICRFKSEYKDYEKINKPFVDSDL